MTANELLCYLTQKHVDRIFVVARSFPSDKLTWQPTPESRSVLDQIQEVATALDIMWAAIVNRTFKMDPEVFTTWRTERAKVTDLDELQRMAQERTDRLCAVIRETPAEELMAPIDWPFPGMKNLVDALGYHVWNCCYHDGQINYMLTLLPKVEA